VFSPPPVYVGVDRVALYEIKPGPDITLHIIEPLVAVPDMPTVFPVSHKVAVSVKEGITAKGNGCVITVAVFVSISPTQVFVLVTVNNNVDEPADKGPSPVKVGLLLVDPLVIEPGPV
jgi:hypothetical protein